MAGETTKGAVEFTPEAERAVEERAKAFSEQLRLGAIDEAIRRRGSASEVTASDVLRAAAEALERESLKAYEKKIDALATMFEEQSARSQMNASELSYSLIRQIEKMAHSVGMTEERERELQDFYKKLQEQSFATTSELRNLLDHELRNLRYSVEASPRAMRPIERASWLYLFAGILFGTMGLVMAFVQPLLRTADQQTRLFGLIGLAGLAIAGSAGAFLIYIRIRGRFWQREK
jgi:hypothetical protein